MSEYEIPSWAGKPPTGFHLDVSKDDKLIQKLMIDKKASYTFGRNSQLNDFSVDHSSCSRVHAVLLYHKHLERFFLVDCGSTHGTYIGNMKIEDHKPTQLAANMKFHFGASTRSYEIRERPQTGIRIGSIVYEGSHNPYENRVASTSKVGIINFPSLEAEIDSLTEFNTARNRQSTILEITDSDKIYSSINKKKNKVNFQETEEIINPEDIDPNVGRFQNMVRTEFIPNKIKSIQSEHKANIRIREKHLEQVSTINKTNHALSTPQISHGFRGLYDELEANYNGPSLTSTSLSTTLGFVLPNPAPHVENQIQCHEKKTDLYSEGTSEYKKKKYPIEAWPGRSKILKA